MSTQETPGLEENDKNDSKLQKEEEEQKKLYEAINKLPSESIKSKAILLYDLNEDMKSQYFDNYKDEKVKIELQENKNFLDYLNKIRDIINTSLNISSSLDSNDEKNYSLTNDEKEFVPIKNFWSTSLINATFFDVNEKDKKVLENLDDICFIPLDYPSFKIEFRFKPNDYMKETTLIKSYYFVENEKDVIKKVEGCEINWTDNDKNPTIKITTKKKKRGKVKETINITKKINSFFNIFDVKDTNLNKELVEAQFFRNDFLQNMLEYYLNIMEIHYDEDGEEAEDSASEENRNRFPGKISRRLPSRGCPNDLSAHPARENSRRSASASKMPAATARRRKGRRSRAPPRRRGTGTRRDTPAPFPRPYRTRRGFPRAPSALCAVLHAAGKNTRSLRGCLISRCPPRESILRQSCEAASSCPRRWLRRWPRRRRGAPRATHGKTPYVPRKPPPDPPPRRRAPRTPPADEMRNN